MSFNPELLIPTISPWNDAGAAPSLEAEMAMAAQRFLL
jgi:hypothetical protein